MSDPFDPVDQWLGTDIELLPPQPGSFERVQRRARRRKAIVAWSTAAGVAVVIAAAVTLPQAISSLLPGRGGNPEQVPVASSTQTPGPSRSPSSTPRSQRSFCSAKASQSNPSIGGPAEPPTPGIEPSSITFVSGTVGAVIGQAASGCEAVAATSDYGLTWSKVNPPPAGAPNGDSGVSQIRFLEANNGWTYGPELYSTHNAGATWTKISGLPGRVIDLATVGGSVYAVVASCTGTGLDYASGCTRFALYASPFSSDNFRPVSGASGQGQEQAAGLQLNNKGNGYLLAGGRLFTGPPDASSPWPAVTISSATVPACLAAKGYPVAPGESGVLAPSGASDVYLLCQSASGDGSLYTSTDSGATWRLIGHVNAQGMAKSLAVATAGGELVLATTAGIYYSADDRHWKRADLSGQAPPYGFGFVGMTTTSRGVAVPAGPGSPVIYVTTDGGRIWKPRHIS